jgi:hypothetical protein
LKIEKKVKKRNNKENLNWANNLNLNENYKINKENGESEVEHNKTIKSDSLSSIKKWLKSNSLSALKLTILDALEATSVKQTPEHVRILDKYVESKVWNDVSNLRSIYS